jgi:hypothetical protein
VKPEDFVGVMYNGIRKMNFKDFERKLRPSLGNLTLQPGFGDSMILAVTIYDIDMEKEIVYISWGYGRSHSKQSTGIQMLVKMRSYTSLLLIC